MKKGICTWGEFLMKGDMKLADARQAGRFVLREPKSQGFRKRNLVIPG